MDVSSRVSTAKSHGSKSTDHRADSQQMAESITDAVQDDFVIATEEEDGRYLLPQYKKREDSRKPTVNKSFDTNEIGEAQKAMKRRRKGMMNNLSIFSPAMHEKEIQQQQQEQKETDSEIKMERPVTPIDKEIYKQPHDWEQMAKYVRRRVAHDNKLKHFATEDQQDLAGILVGEVYHIWPEIRRQIDDPFLSPAQNKELNRRIAVHIVTVCEQLFKHFIKQAQLLNKRGVFSGPANMTRLRAQVSIEAGKLLNVLTIRRYIVADMRGQLPELESSMGGSEDYGGLVRKPSVPKPPIPRMSFKGMLKTSRPKSTVRKHRYTTTQEDLKEIKEGITDLDPHRLLNIISELPRELEDGLQRPVPMRDRPASGDSMGSSRLDAGEPMYTSVKQRKDDTSSAFRQRSNSVPQLQVGESLLQEIGLPNLKQELHDEEKRKTHEPDLSRGRSAEDDAKQPELTQDYLARDLRKLAERPSNYRSSVADDMPPLLQAIICNAKHDGKKEYLEKRLKELEEKEKREIAELSKPFQEPMHPQPATVSKKMPNQIVIRSSDLRVSERVCMESITVRRNQTVYNDLMDDIDSAQVKQLDSNLFLGEKIQEVYQEIMKTVPTDHLSLEMDKSVEVAPTHLDMTNLLSSSTLDKRRKADRVLNPELQLTNRSPWGEVAKGDWIKTPHNPPQDSRGNNAFEPLAATATNLAFAANPQDGSASGVKLSDMPAMVAERLSRSYASWLMWWKSTVNSDDYLKYISTQESDFLGAIFHFYDSDAEDDSDGDEEVVSKMETLNAQLLEERNRKLNELREEKKVYSDGFWNPATVLMGGLGKDPEIVGRDDAIDTIQKKIHHEEREMQAKKKVLGELVKERSKSNVGAGSALDDLRPPTGFSMRRSAQSGYSSQNQQGGKQRAELRESETPQSRLERIWTSLLMTDSLKLNMAIKYSSDEYIDRLEQAIEAWESATQLVVQREKIMNELEAFERLASDPNRFFVRGPHGSSVARFEEARIRSALYQELDALTPRLAYTLGVVSSQFDDTITYQGRTYLEKIKWDRIEMLHWLQEERKQTVIEQHRVLGKMAVRMAPLTLS